VGVDGFEELAEYGTCPFRRDDPMPRLACAALAALLAVGVSAQADSLRVFAAGSLEAAFSDLLRRFPAGPDAADAAEFGPSGLMREKIEAGAAADLFASADMEHARRLALGHPERMVINFTRNRLCALARAAVGLTPENMLDRLLDPSVRLATSTPGADPGGDYAWAVFARADAVHPGARAILEAKAMKLVGGGDRTPLLVPGKGAVEGVFLADRADVMLGYCSSAEAVPHTVPGLVSVALPPTLTVGPAYGMVLLNQKPLTLRFAAFVMSEQGQAVLRAHGFDPTALAEPASPPQGLLVQRAGQAPQQLSVEQLAALKSTTQRVAIGSEPGAEPHAWSGPLLWEVLIAAAVVDPAKPASQVRGIVRVTGSDGYSAVFALAELSPQFAGKPIELAEQMDGAPISGPGLRLVVPDERRGGRSVRDVVRIDVE
jgi:ABC-type molybdate transport system substrate-binding protein